MSALAGRTRALLEVLRAPLLLSPIADVLAGASLAGGAAALPAPGVALAALAGVCLLGAGMAQNARADEAEDRVRKPSRPLPRGAITRAAVARVQAALSLGALLLAVLASGPTTSAGEGLAWIAVAVLGASTAYHAGLKRARVTGCLLLGLCRALSLLLGALAAARLAGGGAAPLAAGGASTGALAAPLTETLARAFGSLAGDALAPPLVAAALYGLYVFGASLHASSDDEPGPSAWSARGTRVALIVVAGLAALVAGALGLGAEVPPLVAAPAGGVPADAGSAHPARASAPLVAAAALALLGAAAVRVLRARPRVPPPALTGVLLSNLYLLDAAFCAMAGAWLAAALVLALFVASRLMLAVFPPS